MTGRWACPRCLIVSTIGTPEPGMVSRESQGAGASPPSLPVIVLRFDNARFALAFSLQPRGVSIAAKVAWDASARAKLKHHTAEAGEVRRIFEA